MFMNLICWLAVGLMAGFAASKIVNERGDDPKLGISLGALGAAVGGFLFGMFSAEGVSAFNARTLWGAVIGAALALAAWHLVRGMGSRTQRTTRKW
jgi:uncharacterized membrane protein YeaQ/YmgE (transglycosylase-associated protein family)